jgi:hypothetical protein
LSAATGLAGPDLLRAYGRRHFGRFVIAYPQFFTGIKSSFQLLERIEDYIHVEVRKLYPEAGLPSFTSARPDEHCRATISVSNTSHCLA